MKLATTFKKIADKAGNLINQHRSSLRARIKTFAAAKIARKEERSIITF